MPCFVRRPRRAGAPAIRRRLRLIPVLASIPLVALAAAGLAAGHLHPGIFWWTAIAAVLLPYVVALLLLPTLVLILAGEWRWSVVNGLLIVLAVLSLAPTERLGARLEPADDDLVVMTFSVPRFGPTVEALAQDILALLEHEQPHVIALQETLAWRRAEAPGNPRIADYMRPALDSLGYIVAIPAQLAERRTPLPVLVRRDGGPVIIEQREGTLAQDARGGRYVRTHMRWRGQETVLYNVHLRGYGADKPWYEAGFPLLRPRAWLPFLRHYRDAFRLRAAEASSLQARLEREQRPVILAGDLNVTSRNWDYRQLARGRTDVFRTAGRGWGGTYRGDLPLVRIDYVLADPAFDAVRAHVPRVRFSDHRPVVARLRWREGIAEAPADISNHPTEPNLPRSP